MERTDLKNDGVDLHVVLKCRWDWWYGTYGGAY